jgi:hypothetical protein
MIHELLNDPSREARLNEILLTYVETLQAGHALDQGQLLATHPEFQNELKAFFASHEQVERIAAPFRQATHEAAEEEILPRSCGVSESMGSGTAQDCDAKGRTADLGQLGDFRLLREVGRGGMGVVYEAEQISLRRRVALKVLPFAAAIDSRQLQRFQNEALAAAHLRHENIVPVHAVGSERGVHFYAMQFVEGESLAGLIGELRGFAKSSAGESSDPSNRAAAALFTEVPLVAAAAAETRPENADHVSAASISRQRCSGKRWYFQWVADLCRQAALALEHAHERGIVHRDINSTALRWAV